MPRWLDCVRKTLVSSIVNCRLRLLDFYTQAMLGLKMDQEVLGELVKAKVPAVWGAMVEHNVMWTLVVSRWFICLFIDILPVEVRRERV